MRKPSERGPGGAIPLAEVRLQFFPAPSDRRAMDDMARKLREVLLGELQDVKVSGTGETGRAATVDVVGDEGTIQISGLELRRLLDLRSHWFTVRRDPARPAR